MTPGIRVASRRIDRPECGYWLLRVVKHGPLVPAAIVRVHTTFEPTAPLNRMERSPFLAAFIAGDVVSLPAVWEHRGTEIAAEEYRFRLADLKWAQANSPADPLANPRKPVDLDQIPIPF